MDATAARGPELRLLGPFELATGGQPVDLGGRKQGLLLAMLAVNRNRPVDRDALVEGLWEARPPASIRAGLQNVVSRARRVLAVCAPGAAEIVARGTGYVLETAMPTDADTFESLARQGQDLLLLDATAAVAAYRAALTLWRGPALAGLADREFARDEAARLDRRRLEVTEALADALMAAGDPRAAAGLLESVVSASPFREDAAGRLMIALYRAGRQADALRVYAETRRVLRDELGIDPGPALRGLEAQVLAQDPALDRASPSAPASATPSLPDEPLQGGQRRAQGIRAFLFTDIEAGTRRREGDAEAMAADRARHDELLRDAVGAHSGRIMSHSGDGLCAAFETVSDALAAAVRAQLALQDECWSGPAALRVRMAVHAGAAHARDGTYFGPSLNRAARLMSRASGGQVLCSRATADLAREGLPAGLGLLDLGEHQLADLPGLERVFQVTHPDLRKVFPPLCEPATPSHNLPAPVDRFLGREAELAELEALLREHRLITLWGPGGAGKTRLSLELGSRAAAGFADGVWFVELSPLEHGELVPTAAMAALGMLGAGSADPTAHVCRYLTARQALLIFDNCEHVLAWVADLAGAILARCPAVRVVTSSRELLNMPGERAWPVPSLSVPPDDADLAGVGASDAVALFCERARASHPPFALTAANASGVAEICRRLDGIPLAIELAAARVRVLGIRGLAARLDDRFRLLTGGARTADPRHQTLRSAVDWSYTLAPQAERDLLNRLSVLPGSFDLATAEAVAGRAERDTGFEVLDLLCRLVDKSLLVAMDDEGGTVRYRTLETIRQYGAEKLDAAGEMPGTRCRLLTYMVSLPIVDWRHRWQWDHSWNHEIHRDHDNLRAALEVAITHGDTSSALALTAGMWNFWLWSDTVGARGLLERALALPGRPVTTALAETLVGLSFFTGDARLAHDAIAVAEELGPGLFLTMMRFYVGSIGDLWADPALSEHLERGLREAQAHGYDFAAAWFHYSFAWRALFDGDAEAAVDQINRAVAAAPSTGLGPFLGAHFLGTAAVARVIYGDGPGGVALAEQVLEITRATLPLASLQAMALARAVAAATLAGRWSRAQPLVGELLALLRRLGTARWVGDGLEFAALVLEGTGRPGDARAVLDAAEAHRAAHDEHAGSGIRAVASALAACRTRLGPRPDDASASTAVRTTDEALLLALRALGADVPPQ